MTMRKMTPQHNKWHRRVEGQIRDCMYGHPSWFTGVSLNERQTFINSLAKRIVGEILADASWQDKRNVMNGICNISNGANGDVRLPLYADGMSSECAVSNSDILNNIF